MKHKHAPASEPAPTLSVVRDQRTGRERAVDEIRAAADEHDRARQHVREAARHLEAAQARGTFSSEEGRIWDATIGRLVAEEHAARVRLIDAVWAIFGRTPRAYLTDPGWGPCVFEIDAPYRLLVLVHDEGLTPPVRLVVVPGQNWDSVAFD